MRRLAAAVVVVLAAAALSGCGSGVFKQYEYDEEIYLSLDGSGTMYVNGSIAALNGLRGTSFDTGPTAMVNRSAVRALYSSPVTHVTSVSTSRRSNRRFVHVRLDVDDVQRLTEVPLLAWSTYRFHRDGDVYQYRQLIGPAAGKPVGNAGWTGRELVAFRLHLPSKITYHNALPGNLKRGNILVWEQSLEDRLRGVPLTLDARMETQSILYRTLWLFGATFVAVALTFAVVLWWILRSSPRPAEGPERAQRT
jgi:hypothetical protein